MPLTPHGDRMKARMIAEYGPKKGESVFFASVNAKRPGFQGSEPEKPRDAGAGDAVSRRMERGLAPKR